MRYLTREEELRQQISFMRDKSDREKWKRCGKTFFVLTGVVYLAAFAWGEISDIEEFLYCLIGVPFLSGLIMFVSMLVMLYISTGALEDEKYIAKLEGELNAVMRNNL